MSDGDVIEPRDLAIADRRKATTSTLPAVTVVAASATGAPAVGDPAVPLTVIEREHVRLVLEAVKGNQSEAARKLGIGRNTLARKLAGDPEPE
jgi:Nif-specific regulatory protein